MNHDPRSLTGKKRKRTKSRGQHLPIPSGAIQLLRLRVATAESLLVNARQQSNQAKRRRKIAKLLAKRARKGAKEAKANLADARAIRSKDVDAVIAVANPAGARPEVPVDVTADAVGDADERPASHGRTEWQCQRH